MPPMRSPLRWRSQPRRPVGPAGGYAQAKARATLIAAAVGSGAMPPWMPGPDSPRFIGQDQRTLTAAERTALLDWVKGGARR